MPKPFNRDVRLLVQLAEIAGVGNASPDLTSRLDAERHERINALAEKFRHEAPSSLPTLPIGDDRLPMPNIALVVSHDASAARG